MNYKIQERYKLLPNDEKDILIDYAKGYGFGKYTNRDEIDSEFFEDNGSLDDVIFEMVKEIADLKRLLTLGIEENK